MIDHFAASQYQVDVATMQRTAMQKHVHIAHHVPGRIRVNIPDIKSNHQVCNNINQTASAVKGVHSVKANPLTGSVVVRYDVQDPDTIQRLKQMLEDFESILSFADFDSEGVEGIEKIVGSDTAFMAEHVPGIAGVKGFLKNSDRRILQSSNGAVDLATVLPLVLAGCLFFFLSDKGNFLRSPLFLGSLVAISLHSYVLLHSSPESLSDRHLAGQH